MNEEFFWVHFMGDPHDTWTIARKDEDENGQYEIIGSRDVYPEEEFDAIIPISLPPDAVEGLNK